MSYQENVILSVDYDTNEHHSLYMNLHFLLKMDSGFDESAKDYNYSPFIDDLRIEELFHEELSKDKFLEEKNWEGPSKDFYQFLYNDMLSYLSSVKANREEYDVEKHPILRKELISKGELKSKSDYDRATVNQIKSTLLPIGTDYSYLLELTFKDYYALRKWSRFENEHHALKNYKIEEFINNDWNIFHHFEGFIRHIEMDVLDQIKVHYASTFKSHFSRLYSAYSEDTNLEKQINYLRKNTLTEQEQTFLNLWLSRFNIGERLSINPIKNVAEVLIHRKNGQQIDLIDFGTSSTGILSLLLTIVNVSNQSDYHHNYESGIKRYHLKHRYRILDDGLIEIRNFKNDYDDIHEDDPKYRGMLFKSMELQGYDTIIVEEPETNLHPATQSILAELFVEASRQFNIQFIIETHSEYLIRKFQALIASKKFYSADLCTYYFKGADQLPDKIDIDQLGDIKTSFGSGFFDEATTLRDEKEKAQERLRLESKLSDFVKNYKTHIKCLVLTEDSEYINTDVTKSSIYKLLKASGFQMQETEIISYESSGKLKQAIGIAQYAKSLSHLQCIIIHVDSDGKESERRSEIEKNFGTDSKVKAFVTESNDIEGYFIKAEHIHALYPAISIEKAYEIINNERKKLEDCSIQNLKKHTNQSTDYASIIYNTNPEKFSYTKKLKPKVNSRLNKELKKNVNIMDSSNQLSVTFLKEIAKNLW